MVLGALMKRQRGAALAEFVIILPIMIVIWAGCSYFWRGYSDRLEAKHAARTEAWQRAITGDCAQPLGVTNMGGFFAQSYMTLQLAGMGLFTQSELLKPATGVEARAQMPAPAVSPVLSFIGGGKPAEGAAYMVCNDRDLPPLGDAEGFIPFALIWGQYAKVE
jgi:hypothetical protein